MAKKIITVSRQFGSGGRSIAKLVAQKLGYDYYDKELTQIISKKYGLSPMKALREFLNSETRSMLENPDLELWAFSPLILFDMWEAEKVTGDPRNSVYIRED